ncbi:MAG: hypothetical protein A2Y25_10270 [Candidatus Melainabacteria bacterium GWF2_37_15]|nr:MAG: hypothetical protein A2Y25_10270 [Candidatus Melainabacteria bacterium GWF2_37_15]
MAVNPTYGNDIIVGNDYSETLYGDAYYSNVQTNNSSYSNITINYGNDTVSGNGGNDRVSGDTYYGNNTNYSGNFNTITVNYGDDTISGGNDNDIIYGENYYLLNRNYNSYSSIITVNSGNDVIYGNDGNDLIIGDSYSIENSNYYGNFNTINLTYGNDTVLGGYGNDIIYADGFYEYNYNDIYSENTINIVPGNDSIDGGPGADTMYGGAGDDIYVVDDISDVVTEYLNQGNDTVQSSIDYTLGDNLENLVLTGTAISGTGNNLDNVLTGNAGNNLLNGGVGSDTYNFSSGYGQDTIEEFNGTDQIKFGPDITVNNLTVSKQDNDLVLFTGNDSITIKNWYVSDDYKIESVLFSDNSSLTASQLENMTRVIISPGPGNHNIHNSGGDDIYLFNTGDGIDALHDTDIDNIAGYDIIQFGEGISKEDIAFYLQGNHLVINYGENDQVTAYNHKCPNHGIEKIELADGSYLEESDINTIIQHIAAYEAQDKGIDFKSVEDVKNNADLMNAIVQSWN